MPILGGTHPITANTVAAGTAAAATTPILANYGATKAHYTVPANGTLNVAVALSAAATLSVAHNASSGTPSYNALNAGASLNANAEYAFSVPVLAGDVIDFQVSSSVTINVFELFFVDRQ